MPYELRKISARKYKVINTDTGVEHSHSTSKKKGEAQIRLLNMISHQQGGGFFSDLGKSIKNVANKAVQGVTDLGNKALNLGEKIVNPSSAYPPELQKLKDELGNQNIREIEIRRTPVPELISQAMNIVSLGSFKKKFSRLPYDKLFHLFMVVKTDNGSQFLLEKNARIHTTRDVPNLPNTTTMKVLNIPSDLTVTNLIDNTQNQMGANFLPYNPVSNNCQNFILSVLQANHLDTPELTNFTKQDTSSLFKSDPTLAKISKGLTDLGASFDVAMTGGKLSAKNTNNSHFLSSINIYMSNLFQHKLPQAEGQVRSALGIPIHLHLHGADPHMDFGVGNMSGSGIDWGNIGRSIANTLNIPIDREGGIKLAKKIVSEAGTAAGSTVLGGIGSTIAGPALGIPLGMLGRQAGEKAGNKVNEQIGSGMRRGRGRPRKMAMEGSGWLSGFLDTPMTPRQVIKFTGNVPGLAKEAAADIRGAGLASDAMDMAMYGVAGKKMPKHGGVTSGVVPMMGKGTGKGSDAMKAKMAALRARKGKK